MTAANSFHSDFQSGFQWDIITSNISQAHDPFIIDNDVTSAFARPFLSEDKTSYWKFKILSVYRNNWLSFGVIGQDNIVQTSISVLSGPPGVIDCDFYFRFNPAAKELSVKCSHESGRRKGIVRRKIIGENLRLYCSTFGTVMLELQSSSADDW